ncbi:MAG: phosphatidylglycerophosphatase A [Pseudomonadota bacterium]
MNTPQDVYKKSISTALASPTGFLAFGLGAGLSRKAPGTVGTLLGMLLWLPFVGLPMMPALLLILLMFVLGIWICSAASKALGVHDHGGIVWDEMVAIWLVLAFMPFDWRWWLAAFVLFRLFDIVKPVPINWLDRRLTDGLGIMVDDIVAAIYTLAVLWLAGWLLSAL